MGNNNIINDATIDEKCTFKENGKILDVIKVTFVTKTKFQNNRIIRLKVRKGDNETIETMYHIIGLINSEEQKIIVVEKK